MTENTGKKHPQDVDNSQGQVTRGASWMALGTLLSRILGLVRETLIMAFFPRFVTDAFLVALRLPNMFRRLLGEGSLSVAFIPAYVETLEQKGSQEAHRLSSGVFSLLTFVTAVVTLVGLFWMEPLIEILVSGKGYASIPGKLEQTIYFARIMFAFIFLMSLYAFFMALLQSYRIFGLPSVAPTLFNLCLIIGLLLPQGLFAIEGEVLAWSVLAGGAAQAGVLLPRLWKMGLVPRFVFWWQEAAVKKVVFNMLPSMLGNGILQITGFANIYFASLLPQGTHSYIYLADRILELPLGLFAVSVGSALLPTLSSLWSQGKKEELVQTTTSSLQLILFVALPCAVGMWILALPITEVIFMHGKFTMDDAAQTANVIQLYSFSLLVASFVRVMAPSFYAMKKTWIPAAASVGGLVVHLMGALFWMNLWGIKGLVFSTILGGACNLLFLLVFYYAYFQRLPLRTLLLPFLKMSVCALGMGVGIWTFAVSWDLVASLLDQSWVFKLVKALWLGIYIFSGAFIYFVLSYLLKIPEGHQLFGKISRKVLGR